MNNKKKLIALVAAGIITAGAIVGGTMAYFSDTQTANNVITMGNVNMDLTEEEFDKITNNTKEITNVMPGNKFTKDPKITMGADSEDAYVRAHIAISAKKDNTDFALTATQISELFTGINIDKTVWYVDATDAAAGNYVVYYNKALTKNNVVNVFTEVKIPTSWGNELANVSLKVDVTVDAVQVANFESNLTKENGFITSWGTGFKAEASK